MNAISTAVSNRSTSIVRSAPLSTSNASDQIIADNGECKDCRSSEVPDSFDVPNPNLNTEGCGDTFVNKSGSDAAPAYWAFQSQLASLTSCRAENGVSSDSSMDDVGESPCEDSCIRDDVGIVSSGLLAIGLEVVFIDKDATTVLPDAGSNLVALNSTGFNIAPEKTLEQQPLLLRQSQLAQWPVSAQMPLLPSATGHRNSSSGDRAAGDLSSQNPSDNIGTIADASGTGDPPRLLDQLRQRQDRPPAKQQDTQDKTLSSLLAPKTESQLQEHATRSLAGTSYSADVNINDNYAELVDADVKLTIVRQETHFSPIFRVSPIEQLARATVSAAMSPHEVHAAQSGVSSESVTKVLELKLQPNDLGTISVRMSISNGHITLALGVEGQEMAHRIERDRDELAKYLQSSGLTLDGVDVKIVRVESNQAPRSYPDAQSPTGSSLMSSNGGPQGGQSQFSSRFADENSIRKETASDQDATVEARTKPSSGLYI